MPAPSRNVERVNAASEAVFIFGTIAMRRGGVTRAILSRIRLYAESGIKVRLLLASHSPHEDDEAAAIRATWSLPDSVELRYFWREAAPGGGGAPPEPLAHATEEPGLTSFTESDGERDTIVRFYDNGVLVRTKRFTQSGRLLRIDHHDTARRVLSRDYFDPRGLLVRTDDMEPELGHATRRRWFDRSGACWLTSWLDKSGKTGKTEQHRPNPVVHDSFGECMAPWIDEVLADSPHPVVFSDTRAMDTVLRALTQPSARKVAVLHNVHTSKPYGADDHTKPSFLPLLEHVGDFDAIIALTRRQQEDIARRYGAGNITVINHPTPPPPDVDSAREPGLLVTVARLETQKRLEHAIRAFAIVAQQLPHAVFDIHGTGSEAAKLKRLVKELRLGDRIRFRGFTSRPLEVFANASATVLCSSFEGMPLVLNEAMGVGTPFVAYDLNYGPDEVIRHEVDGLLVPYGDIDALADAMVRVLADPAYAERLGNRACEVTHRFSAERWRQEWLDLFAVLTGRPIPSVSTRVSS